MCHGGWTPEGQSAFILALAATSCVVEAAARVGMSSKSAYRPRGRPGVEGFAAAWDAALAFALKDLTAAAYARAMEGSPVPHFYRGRQVGESRRYDNRLAMFLLRYYDGPGRQGPSARPLRFAAKQRRLPSAEAPRQHPGAAEGPTSDPDVG